LAYHLEVLPPEVTTDLGSGLLAIWWVPRARLERLPEVGKVLASPQTSFYVPGGKWLRVNTLVGLKINFPSEVIHNLRSLREADQARLLGDRDISYDQRDARLQVDAAEWDQPEPAGSIGYEEVS
jgi:hypothetical protein